MKGHTQEARLDHHKNQLLKLPPHKKDPKCAHIYVLLYKSSKTISVCLFGVSLRAVKLN
jgi:hypothetical protein